MEFLVLIILILIMLPSTLDIGHKYYIEWIEHRERMQKIRYWHERDEDGEEK